MIDHLALAETNPAAALAAVAEYHLAVEGAAIRAALTACHWRVLPAAVLLGYPRHTTLVRAIERHPDIAASLRSVRDLGGIQGVTRGANNSLRVRTNLRSGVATGNRALTRNGHK